jgi:hypothetical protein
VYRKTFFSDSIFTLRISCSKAGVHHPNMAGISHSTVNTKKDADTGAYSIVLSGGYEDDLDLGNVM